jgi:hypothetical protein
VRVTPHVVHRRLFELPGEAVERLIGAFVGERRATPVEELDERAPETLVLARRMLFVSAKSGQQTSKIGPGDRPAIDVTMRAHP